MISGLMEHEKKFLVIRIMILRINLCWMLLRHTRSRVIKTSRLLQEPIGALGRFKLLTGTPCWEMELGPLKIRGCKASRASTAFEFGCAKSSVNASRALR